MGKAAQFFSNPLSILGGVGTAAAAGALNPSSPTLTPIITPAMPIMDATAVSQAAQNSVALQIARQGRQSTIMGGTSSTDKLGG
jgi:hypothetical protein